jgi:hypothetical protein
MVKTSALKATYLVANAAWVVTFGDQILNLEDKYGPIGRFFSDLKDLDYCLSLCGLRRSGSTIALEV